MLYMLHSNLFGWIDGWVLRKVVRNPEIKIWIVWVVGLVAVARVAVRRRRLDLSALNAEKWTTNLKIILQV